MAISLVVSLITKPEGPCDSVTPRLGMPLKESKSAHPGDTGTTTLTETNSHKLGYGIPSAARPSRRCDENDVSGARLQKPHNCSLSTRVLWLFL